MYSFLEKKAIASSKLSHIEKYGFAYEDDLSLIQDALDNVELIFSADGKKVMIKQGNRTIEAVVRRAKK